MCKMTSDGALGFHYFDISYKYLFVAHPTAMTSLIKEWLPLIHCSFASTYPKPF